MMPEYRNGQIPETLLVVFKRGHNSTDGDWYHALSPATYAKHRALVARALARTGRTLEITDGFGAYRPYHAQVIARNLYGNGAALPGTSSHGGHWEGRQTLAMDYGNWAWVYQNHGGQASFFADCRAVGLTPGMIMRSRGYPDEPWHVIDLDPWGPVPAGSDFEEWDDMASKQEVKDALFEVLTQVGLGPGNRNHYDSLKFIADLAAKAATTSAGARADINYIHHVSPYSLKAILEASGRGEIVLTDEQAAAIGGRLTEVVVAGLDAALRDDFDGVKARLAELPAETIAALKEAL